MPAGATPTTFAFNGGDCCGYGADGVQTMGFDCVQIPSARLEAGNSLAQGGDHFCGKLGLVGVLTATSSADAVSICCEYVTRQ